VPYDACVLRTRWLDALRFIAVLALISPAGVVSCSLIKEKSPLAGQQRLPGFPDPIPLHATSMDLPVGVVIGAGPEQLVASHRRVSRALELAGFDKWSVYAFRDGFALVTRWERIEEDGSPAKDRFATRHPKRIRHDFDFDEHVQVLFNAANGDYRMFVFTVTGTDPALTADVHINGDKVGAGRLPEEIEMQSSAERSAEAHVYVFRQQGSTKAKALEGSPLDAASHLTHARIFDAEQLSGEAAPDEP
jgi:hypothetical protein